MTSAPPEQSPVEPGWYTDQRNPDYMLWWDGSQWKDAMDRPPDTDPWITHFLLFVVCFGALYLALSFLVGFVLFPFALRATGRRARDFLTIIIPIWGAILLVETLWRLSARRICWLPRWDLRSKPLFGPSILPKDVIPFEFRQAIADF